MNPETPPTLALFVLALPVACVTWTITHEEVFRELHDACAARAKSASSLVLRKLFYLITCEYCLSHWITAILLVFTRYHLLYADWRGVVVAWFSLVWMANVYMGLFGRLRLDVKHERAEVAVAEAVLQQTTRAEDLASVVRTRSHAADGDGQDLG